MTNLELVKAAIQIANMLFEHPLVRNMGEEPYDRRFSMEDRRDPKKSGGANYYYNRTKSGLFLGYYYGTPSSIWTPWGSWGFAGSSSGIFPDEVQQYLENRLGLQLHIPEYNTNEGTFGPVYRITRLGNLQLPEPVPLTGGLESVFYRSSHILSQDEYHHLKEEWSELFSQAIQELQVVQEEQP